MAALCVRVIFEVGGFGSVAYGAKRTKVFLLRLSKKTLLKHICWICRQEETGRPMSSNVPRSRSTYHVLGKRTSILGPTLVTFLSMLHGTERDDVQWSLVIATACT